MKSIEETSEQLTAKRPSIIERIERSPDYLSAAKIINDELEPIDVCLGWLKTFERGLPGHPDLQPKCVTGAAGACGCCGKAKAP